MITEVEYLADMYKFAGFALMTPFARLVFLIPGFSFSSVNFQFVVYVLISLYLAYLGLVLLVKGYDIVEKERGKYKKWIQQ